MGVTMRFTVRTAAKFAVYEEIRMRVKNHQTAPTIRAAVDLGEVSEPCWRRAARENHMGSLETEVVGAPAPGFHSFGLKRETRKRTMLT
jgi:hypothetical protein